MKSLQSRAVVGGIIWATFSIFIGVFGLATFLDGQTMARFDELLRNRLTQAVISVANNYDQPDGIAVGIGDPAYALSFSGEYWQIENNDGQLFVSQSLVDQLLPQAEGLDSVKRFSLGWTW